MSPGVHRLPTTLRTQHVGSSTSGSGNRFADVEARIRDVWKEDALRSQFSLSSGSDSGKEKKANSAHRSRVLVFCNRGTRVEQLGSYLREKGVENVALTGSGAARTHGSNKHLAGFLKPMPIASSNSDSISTQKEESDDGGGPRVLITTSLLSRGLDFDPSVRNVFIVDPPRNMVDFLHRAGRSGRAGESGKVVVFGKMKGRGSSVGKNLKRRVDALRA